ncbi:MAG: hypothetical protein P8I91_03820 [Phycisphaerales bacterium]|nr:hypothetical protein [Phycisphaerales bacterium]
MTDRVSVIQPPEIAMFSGDTCFLQTTHLHERNSKPATPIIEQAHIDHFQTRTRTGTKADPNIFHPNLTEMHPDAVDWLYQQSMSPALVHTLRAEPANINMPEASIHFQSHSMTILG